MRQWLAVVVLAFAALSSASSSVAQDLIAVGFFGGPPIRIAKIDPATGTPTILATTSAAGLSSAQAAYDPVQQRVFFQDGTRLFVANLATNSVSQVAEAACCPHLLYDPVGARLLGIGFFGSPGLKVATIDPATGTPTILVTTSAAALSSAQAAFDPAQQRVFFQDGTALFVVNLATNNVSQVAEPACCPNLLFDPASSQLLAVGFFSGPSVKVARIDPATGVPTVLATTAATALSGVQATLDSAQQRLFFQDGSRLFTVNLTNGTSSQVTEATCCPPLLFAPVSVNIPALDDFELLALLVSLAAIGVAFSKSTFR